MPAVPRPSELTLRDKLEHRERQTLGPNAAMSAQSRGRRTHEPEHEYRTAFQRDRDRILHSKTFRRLKRKTQVFIAPEGDHYRTRLTHTLEAAQIARTAARALLLNEDLTEAIALGHDLGHTPFGHAGELVLNEVYTPGFHHAEQSLRVVNKLERSRHGPGLNLTWEVRDGILYHSKGDNVLEGRGGRRAATLEGQLVSVCDAIAYINHDVDDALRAGLITSGDLPAEAADVLGETTSQRINAMVIALIEGSSEDSIGMVSEVLDASNTLRSFLYSEVYPCETINTEIAKAKRLFHQMYDYLCEHPTGEIVEADPADSLERRVVDFLAGMTDQYALSLCARLFFPTSWHP